MIANHYAETPASPNSSSDEDDAGSEPTTATKVTSPAVQLQRGRESGRIIKMEEGIATGANPPPSAISNRIPRDLIFVTRSRRAEARHDDPSSDIAL